MNVDANAVSQKIVQKLIKAQIDLSMTEAALDEVTAELVALKAENAKAAKSKTPVRKKKEANE